MDTDRALYIGGTFEGDLAGADTVLITEEGLVSANITAERVIVQGVVVGSVRARQVEVRASGKVWGNVWAQTLYIEPSGFIRGQIATPLQTEPVLSLSLLGASADPLLQSPPDDDLDQLLSTLEMAAQEAVAVDESPSFLQPLHIKEALARVAEAKNWTISQLQLELQAIQSTLAEQEALIATLSADLTRADSEHETALVQRNADLCEDLKRLRVTALRHQQNQARLQVELEETRLALQAAQDEIVHLSTNLTTAKARLQRLNDEIACNEARRDHLAAVAAGASEQLHGQLAEVEAERDRATADLDAAQGLIAQLTDQLAQAHTTAECLAAERASAQADQAKARAAIEQLTADLDAARAEVEHLNSDHAAVLSVVQAERDDVSAELEAARQRAGRLAAERDTALAEQSEAGAAIAQLTADLEDARCQLVQLDGQLAQSRSHDAGLTHQLAEKEVEIVRLQADLQASQSQIMQQRETLDRLTGEHAEALARLESVLPAARLEDLPSRPVVTEVSMSTAPQAAYTAYCLTCRAYRTITNVREIAMPNGRRAIKGHCTICGASLLSLALSDQEATQE